MTRQNQEKQWKQNLHFMVFTSIFQVLYEGVSLEEVWSYIEPTLYVSLENVVYHFPTCDIWGKSCYKGSGMQLAKMVCKFFYNNKT